MSKCSPVGNIAHSNSIGGPLQDSHFFLLSKASSLYAQDSLGSQPGDGTWGFSLTLPMTVLVYYPVGRRPRNKFTHIVLWDGIYLVLFESGHLPS